MASLSAVRNLLIINLMEAPVAFIEPIFGSQEGVVPNAISRENPNGPSCNILVVEDDDAMRHLLVDALQEHGCRVIQCENGEGALQALKAIVPNVIVTDLKMPGGGFPFLRQLLERAPHCPIAVMTAYGDSQSKVKALECGVQGYFDKPLHIHDLKAWICRMCSASSCGNISLV